MIVRGYQNGHPQIRHEGNPYETGGIVSSLACGTRIPALSSQKPALSDKLHIWGNCHLELGEKCMYLY